MLNKNGTDENSNDISCDSQEENIFLELANGILSGNNKVYELLDPSVVGHCDFAFSVGDYLRSEVANNPSPYVDCWDVGWSNELSLNVPKYRAYLVTPSVISKLSTDYTICERAKLALCFEVHLGSNSCFSALSMKFQWDANSKRYTPKSAYDFSWHAHKCDADDVGDSASLTDYMKSDYSLVINNNAKNKEIKDESN